MIYIEKKGGNEMQLLKKLLIPSLAIVLLAACNDEEPKEVVEEEVPKVEETEDEEEEFVGLEVEDIQQIMHQNISNMNETIIDFSESQYDSSYPVWAQDPDDFGEDYQAALSKTEEQIGYLFTEKGFALWGESLTRSYACGCDLYPIITENDTRYDIDVLEQSPDHFIATTYSLPFHGLTIAKNKWHYKLGSEQWKLEEHQFINGEEDPYDLTFELMQELHADNTPVEFVEDREFEGETYIVVRLITAADYYLAYNVNTGDVNWKLVDEYVQ